MAKARFAKAERLCHRTAIHELFTEGHRHYARGLSLLWRELPPEAPGPPKPSPQAAPAQVLIVVPKRKVRRAAHRNPLKRQLREAYRLEKAAFYERLRPDGRRVHLALLLHRTRPSALPELRLTLRQLLDKVAPAETETSTAPKR